MPRSYSPYSFLLIAALCYGGVVAWTPAADSRGELLIKTPVWAVQGSFATNVSSNSRVRQWLGVPYAEPPLGERRFRPPVTKKPYPPGFVLDATAFGPACMQATPTATGLFGEYLPDDTLPAGYAVDEDCLTLNIWSPEENTDELLPVMVWIPGGALLTGGSAVPFTHGQRLAQSQHVVVVSLNYRVNIFGFPGAAALGGQNMNVGLLDQRKAVEWIYQNIGFFGGNASRITLFGQSAGGSSADFFAYAWHDDPLVSAFIIESGAVGNQQIDGLSSPAHFSFVAEAVGCGANSSNVTDYGDIQSLSAEAEEAADAELRCMQQANATDIYNVFLNNSATVTFGGYLDNQTMFANWTDRRRRGLVSNLPTLIGNCLNDFVALYTFTGAPPNQTAVDLLTFEYFTCRAGIAAEARHELGNPVWRYMYVGNWTNLDPFPWLGAYHTAEIPLIFGWSDAVGPDTPTEAAWASYIQNAWTGFARDPANGLTQLGWPKYDVKRQTVVVLGSGNATLPEYVAAETFDYGCASTPTADALSSLHE